MMPIVMPLGMKTLLSEMLGTALLCDESLLMSVESILN